VREESYFGGSGLLVGMFRSSHVNKVCYSRGGDGEIWGEVDTIEARGWTFEAENRRTKSCNLPWHQHEQSQ
jgi:hypothetical protein